MTATAKPVEDLPIENENDILIPAAFRDVIGYHLRVAQEASFQAFNATLEKTDLKPGWYSILTILSEYEGLTPSELSRVCGRDRSTLTSTLKGLSIRGLIERRENPDDQRSYSVRLTDEGRNMYARLHAFAEEHDRRLDSIVGEDKDALIAILARIVGALGKG
ncbi:MarR family transcriptional regulator [Rhizobium bangladeshense]|uniref:MarR family winged helix-turn-helix transcriptional regulator n=1 Tax=Rhizobium bangladeshense TaxID=1138189 RepID=UPI001C83066E|nr:MarR family transcriptional regulator [Rhizobium bangladeshense]MBX4871036.1 MarR family transcriptional regulator [Rhizobium bangladeshense]MBX4871336.1 MarR family transcriptional regulator [Rhizobium bangladeshense]MBX4887600.1 MarR family transcriptional regulator [Rhizobium bangladeshense]